MRQRARGHITRLIGLLANTSFRMSRMAKGPATLLVIGDEVIWKSFTAVQGDN